MFAYSILLICSLLLTTTISQSLKSSKRPEIVSEARYLAVNGQFGNAYKQEDGVEFKEESDDQGNRKGKYSYYGPDGVLRTVTYTAGTDGFRASGDHLPVAPAPLVPPLPQSLPPNAFGSSDGQYNPSDDYDDSGSQMRNYNSNNNQFRYEYSTHFNNAPAFPTSQTQIHPVQHPSNLLYRYNRKMFPNSDVNTPTPQTNQFPGRLSINQSPNGYIYTYNQI